MQQVAKIAAGLKYPKDFAGFGLTARDFPYIIENCRSGSMKANPRPMVDTEVEVLLRKLAGT